MMPADAAPHRTTHQPRTYEQGEAVPSTDAGRALFHAPTFNEVAYGWWSQQEIYRRTGAVPVEERDPESKPAGIPSGKGDVPQDRSEACFDGRALRLRSAQGPDKGFQGYTGTEGRHIQAPAPGAAGVVQHERR